MLPKKLKSMHVRDVQKGPRKCILRKKKTMYKFPHLCTKINLSFVSMKFLKYLCITKMLLSIRCHRATRLSGPFSKWLICHSVCPALLTAAWSGSFHTEHLLCSRIFCSQGAGKCPAVINGLCSTPLFETPKTFFYMTFMLPNSSVSTYMTYSWIFFILFERKRGRHTKIFHLLVYP